MMLTSLLLALPLAGGPQIQWKAPTAYVAGEPYKVQLDITAPEGGTVVASWLVSPAAFTVNGKAVAKREDSGSLALPSGFVIKGEIDLGPYLETEKNFKLGYAKDMADERTIEVQVYKPAPAGVKYMEIPAEELGNYQVLLRTNRGDMMVEFWPDVAPGHVRNFLDLSSDGFYDGTIFHRVIPGFMVQGGDPTGTGTGDGKRKLQPEFNQKPHLAGVISMARAPAVDSASCQFFIVHADSRHLDGQYSGFGELTFGMEVVDAIATTPRAAGNRPLEPQTLIRAVVVQAPK